MIITRLKGGIGNQMFQYALGRKLSILNNDTLFLDIEALQKDERKKDTSRFFALGNFSIQNNIATPEDIYPLRYPYGYISKIWEKISFHILKKHNTNWEPHVLQKKGDIYLDGFWQTEKYFMDIRETLLKEFTPKEPLSQSAQKIYDEIKNHKNSVSIHVRRGDYVSNPSTYSYHGMCSKRYYANALATLTQKIGTPRVYVFSDDIKWVEENIPLPDSTTFISGEYNLKDYEEIWLMSKCSHNIIANSSFSWWGAWLNTNTDKIVIAPTPWTTIRPKEHNKIIPDSWIQLPKN